MRDARLNLLILLILLFAFGATTSYASADNPLPEELHCKPVEIVSVAVV